MRSARRRRAVRFELIPMIDVMMILSLFLAVMAFMPQSPEALQADLPGAKTSEAMPPSLTVTLRRDGSLSLDGHAKSMSEIVDALSPLVKKTPEQSVILAADKQIAYDRVMAVLDALKGAGVRHLALATQPD